ncbi:MAG: heavy-metal-associated domain-containing protein [Candidatus Pacearchaeota archaeon]
MNKQKLEEKIIKIERLQCDSCVKRIETRVSSLQGVKSIKVNLEKGEAIVRFDPKKIKLERIKSEIVSLGYCVCGKKPCICQKKEKRSFLEGIMYGLIPHIGCIVFIIGSIAGVTILMQVFRSFLLNRYFFHILFFISLLFATISSFLYLKKSKLLSFEGIKKKKKYLITLYGSTIGINFLLFMVVFPLLANVSVGSSTIDENSELISKTYSVLKLKVDIPCPGHAPLISSDLKRLEGIKEVKFTFPDIFVITYDTAKTKKERILSLEVFNSYTATILEESSNKQNINFQKSNQQETNLIDSNKSCCGKGNGRCSCGGLR